MPDTLKKLDEGARSMLAALGISPDTFQQQVQNHLLGKKFTQAHSTKKHKNEEFYASLGRLDTIKQVAERAQAARPKVYIPLGYVMYIRHSHCACGVSHTCMDSPSLYLMQTDKIGSPTRLYISVKHVEWPGLPRYIKESTTTTLFCPTCYTKDTLLEDAPTHPTLSPTSETANAEAASCPA